MQCSHHGRWCAWSRQTPKSCSVAWGVAGRGRQGRSCCGRRRWCWGWEVGNEDRAPGCRRGCWARPETATRVRTASALRHPHTAALGIWIQYSICDIFIYIIMNSHVKLNVLHYRVNCHITNTILQLFPATKRFLVCTTVYQDPITLYVF